MPKKEQGMVYMVYHSPFDTADGAALLPVSIVSDEVAKKFVESVESLASQNIQYDNGQIGNYLWCKNQFIKELKILKDVKYWVIKNSKQFSETTYPVKGKDFYVGQTMTKLPEGVTEIKSKSYSD